MTGQNRPAALGRNTFTIVKPKFPSGKNRLNGSNSKSDAILFQLNNLLNQWLTMNCLSFRQRYAALKKNLQHTGDVKAQMFAGSSQVYSFLTNNPELGAHSVESVNNVVPQSGPSASGANCNDDQSSRSSGNRHQRHAQHNSVSSSNQSRLQQQQGSSQAASFVKNSRRSDLLDCSALDQHNKVS